MNKPSFSSSLQLSGLLALSFLASSSEASSTFRPSASAVFPRTFLHQQPSFLGTSPSASSDTIISTNVNNVLSINRGGGGDIYVDLAYDWLCNLGAPAALVAGAVVATMYENIRAGELEIQKIDTPYGKLAKKITAALLMSAFGLQIVSIFVTTVTGTMLLSQDASQWKSSTASSALGFLREFYEFEYLTSRISFLQGLLNWIGAVAIEHTIVKEGEGKAALAMNRFIASSLVLLMALLLSFYNNHMTFYTNYGAMCWRWCTVAFDRYLSHWPPRAMSLIYVPAAVSSIYLLAQALRKETPVDYSNSQRGGASEVVEPSQTNFSVEEQNVNCSSEAVVTSPPVEFSSTSNDFVEEHQTPKDFQ